MGRLAFSCIACSPRRHYLARCHRSTISPVNLRPPLPTTLKRLVREEGKFRSSGAFLASGGWFDTPCPRKYRPGARRFLGRSECCEHPVRYREGDKSCKNFCPKRRLSLAFGCLVGADYTYHHTCHYTYHFLFFHHFYFFSSLQEFFYVQVWY